MGWCVSPTAWSINSLSTIYSRAWCVLALIISGS